MMWPRGAVVFIVLGAVLMPCGAAGDEGGSGGWGIPTAAESTSVPAAEPAGYAFPSARDQFRAWAMNCAGPAAIAGNLAGASWRQWVTDEPPQWDEDGGGFAKRFGTASASTAICETSLSLVSAAMGQDATYYRSPRAGLLPRAGHALAMTILARNRRGEKVFSPGKTISPFVGPLVVENTLYPEGYNFADAMLSGAYSLLINAGVNAAREFILNAPGWNGARSRAAGAPAPTRAVDDD
jgi:hypothetical protein